MSSDNFTCPVLDQNLTVTQAVAFDNTNWILSGHNRVPRFGHTSNITLAITGNNEDVKNYVIGLSAASIALFCFFCFWLLILIVLKCLGYKVGGSVLLPPPPTSSVIASANQNEKIDPEYYGETNGHDLQDVNVDGENVPQDYDEDLEKWKKDVLLRERRIRRIRIAVIISGVIIIVMSVLMIAMGITSLNDSVKDGRDGLAQAEGLTNDAVTLIDSYLYRQNSTLEAARNVQQASNDVICPNLRDVICSNATTFDCNYILNLGSNSAVTSALNEIVTQLVQVRSDLVEAGVVINNIDQQVTNLNWAFWVAAGAVVLMAICTILILNGVILAWQKKLRGTCWQRTTSRIRGWFIVPVFVLLLVIGWVFSMVFVMGYTATSDFCYNSPDENVQAVLEQYKDNFSPNSIVYRTVLFYVSQCPRTSPIFQIGEQFLSFMSQYLGQAIQAIDVISSEAGAVSSECGTNPETLQSALLALESQVCTVASTIYALVDFFTCENFNSLYATVAYSAICYNGNTGFVWIAFTQFMIILCAMIMLTLRIAFDELVDESDLIQVRRGCCPCGRSRQQAQDDDHFDGDDMEEDEMKESQKYEAAKNAPEPDLQSKPSGDGFDEIVSSAVGEAFYENEVDGKGSDNDDTRS